MRTLLLLITLSTAGILDAQLVFEKNLSADLVAADSHGNAYVAAAGVVTKLSPSGSVIYSNTVPITGTWSAIAVDSSGDVVIVGTTGDDTLPTSTAVFQPKRNASGTCITGDKNAVVFPCPDAFVAKLDPSGNLLWASYLGGSVQEQANSVAVDSSGNILVAGLTQSFDFPNVNAFQSRFGGYADGFVTKFTPDGSKIVYSSFMGNAGYDIAHAIAVDGSGNAYIAGEGSGVPNTMESFAATCVDTTTHAFLLKLSSTGSVVYGSCLGSAFSAATAVAVDSTGAAYIGGVTNTTTFPLTSGAFDGRTSAPYSDFITKVSPDGSMLVYSAQLDGASFGIYSVSVDASGAVYAAGSTGSSTMATTGPALQPCSGPTNLVYNFLLKLNPAGTSLTYFSFEDALQHSITVAPAPDGSLIEGAGVVRKFTSLDQSAGPYLAGACVLNGASFLSHLQNGQPGISPGELVTLKGVSLGPTTAANFSSSSSTVGTSLGGTTVLFDGMAAPIVYAQNQQVNVIAPYELSGKTKTVIQVQYQGKTSQSVTIPVSPVSPAVFTNAQTLVPKIMNQDFTQNSASNPAARGSTIVLFITGGGQTVPASLDGQITVGMGALGVGVTGLLTNSSTGSPLQLSLPVIYAGPVTGMISAVQQISVQIPADLPTYFTAGTAATHNLLTVMVGSQALAVPVAIAQ